MDPATLFVRRRFCKLKRKPRGERRREGVTIPRMIVVRLFVPRDPVYRFFFNACRTFSLTQTRCQFHSRTRERAVPFENPKRSILGQRLTFRDFVRRGRAFNRNRRDGELQTSSTPHRIELIQEQSWILFCRGPHASCVFPLRDKTSPFNAVLSRNFR